jgi:hypothetical protein
MGRALAKPIIQPSRSMMGFASLNPSYGLDQAAAVKEANKAL